MGREKERKKDTGSGRTPAENSDKLSDKDRARARLYIRSLVSIKSSPSAGPQSARAPCAPAHPVYTDTTPLLQSMVHLKQYYIYAFDRQF